MYLAERSYAEQRVKASTFRRVSSRQLCATDAADHVSTARPPQRSNLALRLPVTVPEGMSRYSTTHATRGYVTSFDERALAVTPIHELAGKQRRSELAARPGAFELAAGE